MVERMPPPVPMPKRHMWYGPAELGMASPNSQPSTASHHSRVAMGSVLASSVWVITPSRIFAGRGALPFERRDGARRDDALFEARRGATPRAGRRVAPFPDLRFIDFFLDRFFIAVRLAMEASLIT